MSKKPTYKELEQKAKKLKKELLASKQAEAALEESKVNYRLLIENIPSVTWITSEHGKTTFISHNVEWVYGFKPEEIYEKGDELWLKRIHPEDRGLVQKSFTEMLDEGKKFDVEYRIKHKDGEWIWLHDTALRTLKIDNIRYAYGVFSEITKRKKAEIALIQEKDFTDEALNTQSDTFFLLDPATGKALRWNRSFSNISGYTDEEIAKMPAPDSYYSPDDLERAGLFIQKIMKEGAGTIELELICKNGRKVPTEYRVSTIKDDRGEPKYIISIGRDITERKQAEEALQKSEALAKAALNATTHMVYLVDINGNVLTVNDTAARNFGMVPDEIIGTNIYNLFPPEIAKTRREQGNKVIRTGKPFRFQDEREGRFFDISIYPTFEKSGKVDRLTVFVEDITEKKHVEKALEQSREHYRTLFESAGDAIFLVKDGIFIECNQKSLDLYGCTQEQIIGHTPIEFSPSTQPDGNNSKDKAFEKINLTLEGNPQFFEWKHIKHDGTPFDVEVSLTKIDLDSGPHILAVVRDITKRKETESALRESETRFKDLADSLPQIVYEMDKDGSITYANQNAFDLLMYTQEDFEKGLNIFQLLIPEDRDRGMETLKRRLDGEDMGPQEYTAIRKNGSTIPVTVHVNIITHEGKYMGVRGIIIDDTKRKQEEEEKKKLEQQLTQAQKMESIGTLAGGVAHDFNNLLTSIIGHADLALSDLRKEDPLYEDFKEIKRAGERGGNLTSQLLAFSRKQIIQPEILDLNEIITDIEKMLGRLIGENIELLQIPDPELWLVEADTGQMEQVIMNLAINAKDAMPDGGKLTIETSNISLGEKHFSQYGVKGQPGDYVILAVSDTGIGMDKVTQARIFEPFYTTKGTGKGTGLGLSTVYGIIKQNNGFIWIYSELDEGCTFKVYLPKAKRGVVSEKKEKHPVTELGGSETVLIVEDDDTLRQVLQNALKKKGYKVLEAENGENALRISEAYDDSIDLMVTDVVMPKMGGIEVVERLRPLYPHMKVIYMSGYTDGTIAHHGVLAPDLNFIEKPFTLKGLLRKIREVLNTR